MALPIEFVVIRQLTESHVRVSVRLGLHFQLLVIIVFVDFSSFAGTFIFVVFVTLLLFRGQ